MSIHVLDKLGSTWRFLGLLIFYRLVVLGPDLLGVRADSLADELLLRLRRNAKPIRFGFWFIRLECSIFWFGRKLFAILHFDHHFK